MIVIYLMLWHIVDSRWHTEGSSEINTYIKCANLLVILFNDRFRGGLTRGRQSSNFTTSGQSCTLHRSRRYDGGNLRLFSCPSIPEDRGGVISDPVYSLGTSQKEFPTSRREYGALLGHSLAMCSEDQPSICTLFTNIIRTETRQ